MLTGKLLSLLLLIVTVAEASGIVGGIVPIEDLTEEGLIEVVSYALKQLEESNGDVTVELIEVVSATKQVVAGLRYRFTVKVKVTDNANPALIATTLCDFDVWKKSNLQIEVQSHNCKHGCLFGGVSGKPGGIVPIKNLKDEGLIEVANYAVKQIEKESNRDVTLVLIEIVSATKQVVAGIKYRFTVKVKVTDNANPALIATTLCDFDVWKKSNLQVEVQSHNCKHGCLFGEVSGKPGGIIRIKNLKDKRLVEVANYAVKQIEKESNRDVTLVLIEVVSATKQVVAGLRYRFTVKVKVTDNANPALITTTLCDFDVWQKPNRQIDILSNRCQGGSLFA